MCFLLHIAELVYKDAPGDGAWHPSLSCLTESSSLTRYLATYSEYPCSSGELFFDPATVLCLNIFIEVFQCEVLKSLSQLRMVSVSKQC